MNEEQPVAQEGSAAASAVTDIKEGDVFSFAYSEEYCKKMEENCGYSASYLRHCFDGQLVATKPRDGKILLADTYWGDSSARRFTIDDARERGTLTFRFNANDVEKAYSNVAEYYDDADWFDFSHQHGCYKRFVVKKGAQKSKAKMLETANRKLREAHEKLANAAREVEHISADRQKVELGDLNVYF